MKNRLIPSLGSFGRDQASHAFTLIELLAVISITAVLAALLFPVVTGAQDKGREAACISNLRELAGACVLFSVDNDGKFPYTSESGGSAWHSRIYEFVGKEGTRAGWDKNRYYRCLADKNPYADKLSYVFNKTLKDLRRGNVSKSAVMLGEGSGETYAFDIDNAETALGYRHRKGANFAFSDGRVEWHLPVDVTEEFLSVQR